MTADILHLSKWDEPLPLPGTNPHKPILSVQKYREYFPVQNTVSVGDICSGTVHVFRCMSATILLLPSKKEVKGGPAPAQDQILVNL